MPGQMPATIATLQIELEVWLLRDPVPPTEQETRPLEALLVFMRQS